MLKLLAVTLAVFSVMVIWSECVFFIASPVLSIFALFIGVAGSHFAYTTIQVSKIICTLLELVLASFSQLLSHCVVLC